MMVSKILYYFFILPLAYLPYWVLYGLSDLLYLFLYKVLRYRVALVRSNMQKSFPDKDSKWIKEKSSDFYRHFCDLIIEGLKGFTITKKQALKRMKIENPEILLPYYKEGRHIIGCGGHYNNWEILVATLPYVFAHKISGIYKALSNDFINQKIALSRSKHGTVLMEMKQTKNAIPNLKAPTFILWATDQSPSKIENAIWLKFLNQNTPVMFGAEKYAKQYNMVVIYGHIKKIKRGHYSTHIEVVSDKPGEEPFGAITAKHTKCLELDIQNKPEFWLWTHKRWKHSDQFTGNYDYQ